MDNGTSIANPYASVTIPRAQLKSSFVRNTIGEDLDGVVITNPAAVPTYSTNNNRVGNNAPTSASWEGNKIHTQESWRRPYNPYNPSKPQNGGHPDAMYAVDLDKHQKEIVEEEGGCGCCCCPCCKCSPCCCKCCCVVS